ncbi:MAG: bacterioferritin-associated ferredoxin [Catenulispora sp.]
MYACICHAVTTAEVDAAVALGATTVRQVRTATGAGGSCGTCVKRLSCLLAAARVADSAPAEAMPEAERLPAVEELPAVRVRPAVKRLPAQVPAQVTVHAAHCPAALSAPA